MKYTYIRRGVLVPALGWRRSKEKLRTNRQPIFYIHYEFRFLIVFEDKLILRLEEGTEGREGKRENKADI